MFFFFFEVIERGRKKKDLSFLNSFYILFKFIQGRKQYMNSLNLHNIFDSYIYIFHININCSFDLFKIIEFRKFYNVLLELNIWSLNFHFTFEICTFWLFILGQTVFMCCINVFSQPLDFLKSCYSLHYSSQVLLIRA